MKFAASALLLWSFAATDAVPVNVTTNTVVEDENSSGQLLEVFIALQTRLDNDEMERIHSSYATSPKDHELEQLKADKQAVLLQAKAHVKPCLQSFQSSIKEHNNNNNNSDVEKGGLVELVPFSKDSSRFHLTGSAKDFAMFLEKKNDGDNDDKAQFDISTETHKFPEILAQCIGFVGTFRRHHLNEDKEDDTTNSNRKRVLASEEAVGLLGSCFVPDESFDKYRKKFQQDDTFTTASEIRNIYGVPEVNGRCHGPRDSAVFEFDQGMSVDDLACYTQYNNLPDTTITHVGDKFLYDEEMLNPVLQYPHGFCSPIQSQVQGVKCSKAQLDVEMLAAMNAGTNIKAYTYFPEKSGQTFLKRLESLYKALSDLTDEKDIPAVMSISYGAPENEIDGDEYLVDLCSNIGTLSAAHGTTFFVSSGDNGASDGRGCGKYTPLFLASCPHVTTVGGTSGTVAGKEELSTGLSQGLNIVSGGGFSDMFPVPNYQLEDIIRWLYTDEFRYSLGGYSQSKSNPSYGPPFIGPGYPDVSAISANIMTIVGNMPGLQAGTGASASIFAGMVSLCASQLPHDRAGFGLINPTLYNTKDLFFDIKGGNNQYVEGGRTCYEGCESDDYGLGYCEPNTTKLSIYGFPSFYGFGATEGWDPASGLGTLGTTDPNDKTKGFLGLCNALLKANGVTDGWDSKKLNCGKKVKKTYKKSKAPKAY